MICEPEPVVQAAAKRLIEEWKRIDIKVELITLAVGHQAKGPHDPIGPLPADRPPAASGQDIVTAPDGLTEKPQPALDDAPWDLAYRTVRMTEPMMELWPLLSLDNVASVQSVRYLPDWLRQGLIDLDRTADWTTTVQTLHELHRQLADTVQLIPLWEVDDALVFRKTIRGIPDLPLHAYQDLELWISEPWYLTDGT
jgi:ABC-type transport system substrate-binding protein